MEASTSSIRLRPKVDNTPESIDHTDPEELTTISPLSPSDTPEAVELIVILSPDLLVVILMLVPATNVKVSLVESATTSS